MSASVRWDVKPKIPGKNPESTPLGIRLDAVNRIATASVEKAIEESDLILIANGPSFKDSSKNIDDLTIGQKLDVIIIGSRIKFRSDKIQAIARPV